jgi:hypothetical protein
MTVVSVTPLPGFANQVVTAQQPVLVSGADAIDGYIINPGTIIDQGLPNLNILYVDPTGPAAFVQTATTIAVQPGGRFDFPPNVAFGIWVNSQASGHKFVSVQIVPTADLPPAQQTLDDAYLRGNFPPPTVTGVTKPIPSYLYQEYSDDDDLQGFVAAYNSMMQDIVDTFNGLNLPNYTSPIITGALLDWVAQGVYGFSRPSLLSGKYKTFGPYNTGGYNTQVYDWWQLKFPDIVSITNDDLFKRILTWHVSKRDGKYFNIEWLKKRIMRFLFGVNGTQPNIDNSYQVSITFGPNYECTIRFVTGIRTLTGGALYNQNKFTYNTMTYNSSTSTHVTLTPLPYIDMFQEAVQSGILELPFQFNYTIVIG